MVLKLKSLTKTAILEYARAIGCEVNNDMSVAELRRIVEGTQGTQDFLSGYNGSKDAVAKLR